MITFEEMRFLLLLLFGCATLVVSAQGKMRETLLTDTSVVASGVFKGDTFFWIRQNAEHYQWTLYYDAAHQQKAAFFDTMSGKWIGVSKEWYRNGQLKREHPQPWSLNQPYEMTEWYADGTVKMSRRCTNDTCISLYYYPKGALKKRDIEARNANGDLVWITTEEFYENGQLVFYPNDVDNVHRLTYYNYYSSGSKMQQVDMQAGSIVGIFMEWYENGQLKCSGQYENPPDDGQNHGSFRTGKWSYFDETGKLIREEWYEHDLLVKTVTY